MYLMVKYLKTKYGEAIRDGGKNGNERNINMSLYLKRLAEPEDFAEWKKVFESENKRLLKLSTIPQHTDRKSEAMSIDDLRYFIRFR